MQTHHYLGFLLPKIVETLWYVATWCEEWVVLLETIMDPHRFAGIVYTAANWVYVGDTKGARRTPGGYSATAQFPKRVFVRPLRAQAQTLLAHPVLAPQYHHGASNMKLHAEQMNALPAFFADMPDLRRAQGRRHQGVRPLWLPLPGRALPRPERRRPARFPYPRRSGPARLRPDTLEPGLRARRREPRARHPRPPDSHISGGWAPHHDLRHPKKVGTPAPSGRWPRHAHPLKSRWRSPCWSPWPSPART